MGKIILFTRRYSEEGRKFQEALEKAGVECRNVVLEDDGFLPERVISPYEYYILQQNREKHAERKVHYNFLELPEFWEIRPKGDIWDMGRKRGSVVCTEPVAKGIVQRVEWQTKDGWVYRIDCYNKYGLMYASEFVGKDREVESKVYYSDNRQEVIVEQPQNDVITLLQEGKIRAFFLSYQAFLEFFLEEAGCSGDRVLWIEEEEDLSLLNRITGGNRFWKCLVFRKKEWLDRYPAGGGENGYVYYEIPVEYPANSESGEALILTASDKIAGIEDLIRELPEIRFHIAANTQVSDKLFNLQRYTNVKVYPQIGKDDLENLWRKCSFYLDINFHWEIHDAINQASWRNLLILGFEDTLHRKELVAKECVLPGQDYEGMIKLVKELSCHSEKMLCLLEKQQTRRRSAWERLERVLESEEN